MDAFRIGHGYDSHRFGANRPLKLGGVEIPGAPGLQGHSLQFTMLNDYEERRL